MLNIGRRERERDCLVPVASLAVSFVFSICDSAGEQKRREAHTFTGGGRRWRLAKNGDSEEKGRQKEREKFVGKKREKEKR